MEILYTLTGRTDTNDESIGGTHTVETMIKRGELLVYGLVQQIIHVEVHVL